MFRSDRKDWKANTHNQRLRKEFLRESVLVKRESHVHLRGKRKINLVGFGIQIIIL